MSLRLAFVSSLGFALATFGLGCANVEDDGGTSASHDDELAVDRNTLPTTHALLTAGDPYSPVLDDRPLAIDGAQPCLTSPRVEITPGSTAVEASIVASRRDLMNRLDLGVEGVPINVLKLTGARAPRVSRSRRSSPRRP
jgi:hypothetical protein